MSTISVELPEGVDRFVTEKVAQQGYGSASEFIVAVLAACQQRETIEHKLLAAIESNNFEAVTPELWNRLRA